VVASDIFSIFMPICGIDWTFLIKAMRAALRMLGPWKRAVLGGDDIAARTEKAPVFDAKAS